jgi:hypothetical protein
MPDFASTFKGDRSFSAFFSFRARAEKDENVDFTNAAE